MKKDFAKARSFFCGKLLLDKLYHMYYSIFSNTK